jgi:threonine synthase
VVFRSSHRSNRAASQRAPIDGARCVRCGTEVRRGFDGPCRRCGPEGPLELAFDLRAARRTLTRRSLAGRPPGMFRYAELLPLRPGGRVPPATPGGTPLFEEKELARWLGVRRLRVKDETRNPTGSLKDRASAVGVARALAQRARVVACASTGNAATSLAGAAAAVGLRCVIFVPRNAPEPKLAQLLVFGARVIRVAASYDETWEMCQRACDAHGWYNRNAAVNPTLIEGKKTAGLEIAEQVGDDVPDWVAVAVGDGCTLAGVWKGLKEMRGLGFIPRLPRMLGVQSEGAQPLVTAFRGGGELVPTAADTIADGISVGHPRNWRKALAAVRESRGDFLAIPDAALLETMREAGTRAGLFGEPAGVAGLAGLRAAVGRGIVRPRESALTLLTGTGLKDTRSALRAAGEPVELPPEDAALARHLAERPLEGA